MIIMTCKGCATTYLAEDGEIGEKGRGVQCANCGHRWRVGPDGLEMAPPPPPPPPVEGAVESPQVHPEPDELPPLFATRRAPVHHHTAPPSLWIGLGILALFVLAVMIFRGDFDHRSMWGGQKDSEVAPASAAAPVLTPHAKP